MEKIGLDVFKTNVYVKTTNGRLICSLDTIDYLNEQMNREDIDKISITIASLFKTLTIDVKKSSIKEFYLKGTQPD